MIKELQKLIDRLLCKVLKWVYEDSSDMCKTRIREIIVIAIFVLVGCVIGYYSIAIITDALT